MTFSLRKPNFAIQVATLKHSAECYEEFYNHDETFKHSYLLQNEMKNFTTLIVDMMKKEKLFASQGGPIIIAQVIYMHIIRFHHIMHQNINFV